MDARTLTLERLVKATRAYYADHGHGCGCAACRELRAAIIQAEGVLMDEAERDRTPFKVGDRVIKCTGDYRLEGRVVGVAFTSAGVTRYIVEHVPSAPGLLHIYSEVNLSLLGD